MDLFNQDSTAIDIDEAPDPPTKAKIRNGNVCYYFDLDGRERVVYRAMFETALVRGKVFRFPDGYSIHYRHDHRGFTLTVQNPQGMAVTERTSTGNFSLMARYALALYADAVMKSANGGETSYGGNIPRFLDWLISEMSQHGFIGWMLEKKMWLPFPDELWAIYRVWVMGTYNIVRLPMP